MNQTRAKLKVAVIGLGWVAQHRHIPWLSRNPQVELVGLIDRNPDTVRQLAQRFPRLQTAVTSEGQADWLQGVDAVTIATNPQTHYRLAKSLLEQGKHVLVEKPMAMTVAEAEDLSRLAQANQKVLAVVHNFQFARSVRQIKSMIADGKLGRVLGIEAVQFSNPRRRLPVWHEQLPLGLFYDESPHLLYLIRSLLDQEPELVSAQVAKASDAIRTPACVNCLFVSQAVPIRVSMNFCASVSEWHLIVLGTDRVAVADIFRDVLVVAPSDGAHRAQDILQTSLSTLGTHMWGTLSSGLLYSLGRLSYGNDLVIANFVEAIRSGNPPPGISAQDGLRIVEWQNQIAQSPILTLSE